jgi:hypothetical protein
MDFSHSNISFRMPLSGYSKVRLYDRDRDFAHATELAAEILIDGRA